MPTTSGPRQDYALKTLRRTVEMHAAKRATAAAADKKSGAAREGFTTEPLRARAASKQMPPETTLPASNPWNSQPFSPTPPETALPASQAWNQSLAKLPSANCGDHFASQSTQVPSHVPPTPVSTQSNSQFCASQPLLSGSQCMSQPLFAQIPSSQNAASQCLSQPLLMHMPSSQNAFPASYPGPASQSGNAVQQPQPSVQGFQPVGASQKSNSALQQPGDSAMLMQAGSSSNMENALSVLAAAFAGLAGNRVGEVGKNEESIERYANFPRPRRRIRGKQPWPPQAVSPDSFESETYRRRSRRRRRHVETRTKKYQVVACSDGEQTGSSLDYEADRKARPSPAPSARSSNASELTALSQAANSAVAALLSGPLQRGLRCINEEYRKRLGRIRKEADEVLALLSAYRRECVENDGTLNEVTALVEDGLVAVQAKLARKGQNRLALLPAPPPAIEAPGGKPITKKVVSPKSRGRDFLASLRNGSNGNMPSGRHGQSRLADVVGNKKTKKKIS